MEQTRPKIVKESPVSIHKKTSDTLSPPMQKTISIRIEKIDKPITEEMGCHLSIPKVAASSSSETLTG